MLREQEKLNARLVRDGRIEDWRIQFLNPYDYIHVYSPSIQEKVSSCLFCLYRPNGRFSGLWHLVSISLSLYRYIEYVLLCGNSTSPWYICRWLNVLFHFPMAMAEGNPMACQDHIDFLQSRKVCAMLQVR